MNAMAWADTSFQQGRMDSILDAEVLWRDFLSSTVHSTDDRYVRINPAIDHKPPNLMRSIN